MRGLLVTAVVTCATALAPAAAGATMIGTTTIPSGGTAGCLTTPLFVAQTAGDPSFTSVVPAGGGTFTGWQTNTTGATAGAALSFLVLRPAASGSYTVIGVDSQNLPTPLPADDIARFTLATPIAATAGDLIGLYVPAAGANCLLLGPGTMQDRLVIGTSPTTPAPGGTLTTTDSGAGYLVDLAADLATTQDVRVTASAGPANAIAGAPALLAATVTSGGPESRDVTFRNTVPAGLTVSAVLTGGGSCTTSGQVVTCTMRGLAPGRSAPVVILVTPSHAGTFADTASVSAASADPNPSNNAAHATLTVAPRPTASPPPAPRCQVPALRGLPRVAATRVLKLLNCRVGKIRPAHSRAVRRGLVISSTPGRGSTRAANTKVGLVVSSGPAKKHKRRHR